MEDIKNDASLKRGLKQRHLTMIGLRGSIGTGLFVALGYNITAAGPGGALLAYVITGALVYFLGQFYAYGDFTLFGFFVAYVGLFIFLACFLGYKFVKKTKWIKPLEADLKHYPDKNI